MGEFFYKRVGGSDGPAWILDLKRYGFTLTPRYPEAAAGSWEEREQTLSYLDNSLRILDYPECQAFAARRPGKMFEIMAKLNGCHFYCYEDPNQVITGANCGNWFRYRALNKEEFVIQICNFFSRGPSLGEVCYELELEKYQVQDFYPFRSYGKLYQFMEMFVEAGLIEEEKMDTVATSILCVAAENDICWALDLGELDWALAEENGRENELQIPAEIAHLRLRNVRGMIAHLEQLMTLLPPDYTLDQVDLWADDIDEDNLEQVKAIKERFQCTVTFSAESFAQYFDEYFDDDEAWERWSAYFSK